MTPQDWLSLVTCLMIVAFAALVAKGFSSDLDDDFTGGGYATEEGQQQESDSGEYPH